ncbi:hypothetical protein FRC04_001452 [Tulasnella sp. 424]|nr:hypothetical protein FRC04_001452 [Tulasnella sp. 424]
MAEATSATASASSTEANNISSRVQDGDASTSAAPLRYVDGRAFNSRNDAYLLPGDAEEHARLDAQHSAITLMFGGLFPSQAQEEIEKSFKAEREDTNVTVLDIGTGSGVWAMALAKQFPNTDVIGLDIVPVNPSSEPPPNCLHVRALLQGIKDYTALFQQIARLLQPGGVLLVVEPTYAGYDGDKNRILAKEPGEPGFTWFHRMFTFAKQATMARNPSLCLIEKVGQLLTDMGGETWQSVQTVDAFIPIGIWSTDPIERLAGDFMRQNALQAREALRSMFLSSGLTAEDVDQFVHGLTDELTEARVQQYLKLTCTWAVKAA